MSSLPTGIGANVQYCVGYQGRLKVWDMIYWMRNRDLLLQHERLEKFEIIHIDNIMNTKGYYTSRAFQVAKEL